MLKRVQAKVFGNGGISFRDPGTTNIVEMRIWRGNRYRAFEEGRAWRKVKRREKKTNHNNNDERKKHHQVSIKREKT